MNRAIYFTDITFIIEANYYIILISFLIHNVLQNFGKSLNSSFFGKYENELFKEPKNLKIIAKKSSLKDSIIAFFVDESDIDDIEVPYTVEKKWLELFIYIIKNVEEK